MKLRRREMLALLAAIGPASRARARPVRVGRFTSIPHGFDPDHPEIAVGGPARTFRCAALVPDSAPALVLEREVLGRQGRRVGRGWPLLGLADGSIVVSSAPTLAVHAPSGEPRFSLSALPPHGPPVIAPDGSVLLATQTGAVMAIDLAGTSRARAEVGAAIGAQPLVLDDGSLVLAPQDGTVRLLDPTLRERWRLESVGGTQRGLTRDGDRVIITAGSELAVVSLDGTLERTIPLPGRVHAPAARADDGTLWVLTTSGELVSVEGRRRLRERVSLGVPPSDDTRVAIAIDGSLRIPCGPRGLIALSPSGELRWELPHASPPPGAAPAPAAPGLRSPNFAPRVDPRGTTLLADRGPHLTAIDPDGTIRWQIAVPLTVVPPLVMRDRRIAILTVQGLLLIYA